MRIFREGLYSLVNELEGNTTSQETSKVIDEEIISIFIPMMIKKRSGKAQIILPREIEEFKNDNMDDVESMKNMSNNNDDNNSIRNYDEKLIRAFARAYKWKRMLQEGEVNTLIEICRKENISHSYGTSIYKLNFIAPKIVEAIVEGRQPDTLGLRSFVGKSVPELWSEQMEMWGFAK